MVLRCDIKLNDRVNLIHTPNTTINHPKDTNNYIEVMKGVSKVYKFDLRTDEADYLYAV